MNVGLNNSRVGWQEVILFVVLLLILEKGVAKESVELKVPSESNFELEWISERDIEECVQWTVDWIELTCSSYFHGNLELDSELFTEENVNAIADNWERLVEEEWLWELNPEYADKMNNGEHSLILRNTLLPQDSNVYLLVGFDVREREESGDVRWSASYERADFSYAFKWGYAPFGECTTWFFLEHPRLNVTIAVIDKGFCTEPSGERIEAEWQNLLNVVKEKS